MRFVIVICFTSITSFVNHSTSSNISIQKYFVYPNYDFISSSCLRQLGNYNQSLEQYLLPWFNPKCRCDFTQQRQYLIQEKCGINILLICQVIIEDILNYLLFTEINTKEFIVCWSGYVVSYNSNEICDCHRNTWYRKVNYYN